MPTVGGAIGDPLYRPVHSVDPEGASHEIDTIYTLSILIFIKTATFKGNLFSHMEESMRGNLSPDPQKNQCHLFPSDVPLGDEFQAINSDLMI